jgi:hypothetical protein
MRWVGKVTEAVAREMETLKMKKYLLGSTWEHLWNSLPLEVVKIQVP